ncbi:MAG: OmpA family protein [Granulosicoccus sp.]
MKNKPLTSRPPAFTILPVVKQPEVCWTVLRQSVITVLVASVLSGCAAMSAPEKIKLDIPANTSDFKNRLYTGVSMGNSHLSPNTRGEGFSADSSGDMGTQLRLGYDVHNMLAVEVDTSVLGTSALSPRDQTGNVSAEVKYSAATVSALVYGWSGVQSRSRREGLSAYGRVGFSALKKSSNVVEIEESGTVPILGIGAEYGFVNGLGIRAEITRFDSDVTYMGFGAIYRFGLSPKGIGRMIAEAAEPALSSESTKVVRSGRYSEQETVVERYAGPNARPAGGGAPHLHYTSGAEPNEAYVGSMADRWRPAMRADDHDSDGVLDNVDSCPDTAKHVTVDRYGCGLFDAVLHEVTFKSGSRWLTPRARAQLDLLGETLLAFPEARIQVRAHTDSQGAADMNLGLSTRRAEVVVQYLQSRGVHELQLQAVGMGESQPLDSNENRKGRLRNRRVDIVTLPDQDAGQLLLAVEPAPGGVMTVQNSSDKKKPAGSLVATDDWNSAPPFAKPKKPGNKPMAKPSSEPGLMAAMPDSGKKPAKSDSSTTRRGQVHAPAVVTPLPQPGFAPNFRYAGVLDGVTFERGNSTLSDESVTALQPLKDALLKDVSIRVAIMAHTDDKGSTDDNKALSTKRAESVVEFLVKGGINAMRLKAEGYGELLPLVQNVTEADRQRNRRIEVRVLQ